MTSSLGQIRDALKSTIAQAGLNVYDTVPDVTNSPACVVLPFDTDFTGAMRMGGDMYRFDLYVLVANNDTRSAQDKLDRYLTGQGPSSIREFVFQNPNLGLPDVDCVVQKMSGYGGSFQEGGINMIGAKLRLCVTVT